ncbi:MAG: hypothetical protein M3083_00045 [Actinomycetota bacterium]|nr:hypothetical protein [Actinomycetota bacterium]MDQ6946612.1 hypothetical protein [Actinomycetota bacterium]
MRPLYLCTGPNLANRANVAVKAINVDDLLKQLLPDLAPDAKTTTVFGDPKTRRLLLRTAPPANRVTWQQIWSATAGAIANPSQRPSLGLDFGAKLDDLIYDIIFSLSFRAPVASVATTPSAV